MLVREDLLDAKFAHDTAIYLRGHEANLAQFQDALEHFCDASGAICRIHVVSRTLKGTSLPQWKSSPQFRWFWHERQLGTLNAMWD